MKPQLIDLEYSLASTFQIKEIDVPYFVNIHHFHNDYEIVYVKTSTGKRVIGDHVNSFQEGDIVFVGPGLSHAWFNDRKYYEENTELRAKSVVIYLRKNWLEEGILSMPQTDKLKRLLDHARRGVCFTGDTNLKIAAHLTGIADTEGLWQVTNLFTILSLMSESTDYQLLSGLNYQSNQNENETGRLNRVYEYVTHNFSEEIRLKDVADIANMSSNAFCRYFHSRTQKNFSQFVNEIRVGHACQLLKNKDLTVTEISYESGYQSITNFNKFFRRITGKSPMEYRKSILDRN